MCTRRKIETNTGNPNTGATGDFTVDPLLATVLRLMVMMNAILLILLATIAPSQPQEAKDPTGTWKVSDTETRFRIEKVEDGLAIHLGAEHDVYTEYEVVLKPAEQLNAYRGGGYFVARLSGDRECRFETQWQIGVSSDVRIVGVITSTVPAPEGCTASDTTQTPIDLRRESDH